MEKWPASDFDSVLHAFNELHVIFDFELLELQEAARRNLDEMYVMLRRDVAPVKMKKRRPCAHPMSTLCHPLRFEASLVLCPLDNDESEIIQGYDHPLERPATARHPPVHCTTQHSPVSMLL